MEFLFKVILFYLCIQTSVCGKVTYKVAVTNGNINDGVNDFRSLIGEASKQNADVVLLSTGVSDCETSTQSACRSDNYDDLVRHISSAAKKFGVYVVTHLYDEIRCRDAEEQIKSNLVFDRRGSVVLDYRRPLNYFAPCNVSSTKTSSFVTDFGVKFVLLTDEDVIRKDLQSFKSTKNFIITGGSSSAMEYLNENGLLFSWAYTSNANVVSDSGVFAGRAGAKTGAGLVYELNKDGGEDKSHTISFSRTNVRDLPAEDPSQHTFRALDLEASAAGYTQVVCDGEFCCEFYVKTKQLGLQTTGAQYGLCASGARCVCSALQLENNIDMKFEKISIKANFTKHSAQYPIILTSETSIASDKSHIVFDTKPVKDVQEVSVVLSDAKIFKLGIFERDFTQDFRENSNSNHTNYKSQDFVDFYEFIFNEDVVEFFDYLWIRLRVLILIVSVYILEMM